MVPGILITDSLHEEFLLKVMKVLYPENVNERVEKSVSRMSCYKVTSFKGKRTFIIEDLLL